MILMVHGYGLNGSGSNLWTRSVVAALCEQGLTVHLCCQERRPEQFEFIREVIDYDEEGRPVATLTSNDGVKGGCVLHRPSVDVLPTFVRPSAGAASMASILDMDEDAIEDYLQRNERALQSVLTSYPIASVHVNHVVLMSEAVRRACRDVGRPYAVMPHGSAIEYVVKQSEAMHAVASTVLQDAERILVLNNEMRDRITSVFSNVRDSEVRMLHVPVGVDVRRFRAVPRDERPRLIHELKDRLGALPRGRGDDHEQVLRAAVVERTTLAELHDAIEVSGDYVQRNPDAGVETRLDRIDWENGQVVGYVGRVLGHKGVHALIGAFPLILDRHPDASLVIAGSGPLREWLEAFILAAGKGDADLIMNLARWGGDLEGAGKPLVHLTDFLDARKRDGTLEAYLEHARRMSEPGRVLLTGYMDHTELSLLFACLDVAVFPSIVREASPLVVPEAMASGVFPMGTDQGGMAASLDHASAAVPEDLRPYMRIRPEPEHMVSDIAENVTAVLDSLGDRAKVFHDYAVEHYDWQQIARRMMEDLERLSAHPA